MKNLRLRLYLWLHTRRYRVLKYGVKYPIFTVQERLSSHWWWDDISSYSSLESAVSAAETKRKQSIDFHTKEFNTKEEVVWP